MSSTYRSNRGFFPAKQIPNHLLNISNKRQIGTFLCLSAPQKCPHPPGHDIQLYERYEFFVRFGHAYNCIHHHWIWKLINQFLESVKSCGEGSSLDTSGFIHSG
ncbi:unnamed protein product [Lepeophtheirus salmonis]|uniref:(salmon louse) hypothetical protein n=1 Tax=Lepeophtheirus salmonis TaxID=72036 RepID=A0A7R8D4B0_LEPSM|nr:unnamed protein product [Lepeophtheirus salmonis]CAF3024479.1 unnamed protein product [Lepeophtheirus salmonis]